MNQPDLQYPRIIKSVRDGNWLITPSGHAAIVSALEAHVNRGPVAAKVDFDSMFSRAHNPEYALPPGVALVEASGIIGKRLMNLETMCGGMDVNAFVSAVETAANSPGINTVVIDWDSPGGTVTGVPEAGEILRQLGKTKTLISYTETQMCSGAQWLASCCASIYAAASADVGSVGVYNMIIDQSAALADMGIRVDPVQAGKWKLMGASFRPMSDDERAMIQRDVNSIHADFKKVVSKGRDVDPAALEGQVLSGKEALKAGLIDGIYPTLGALLKKLG